MKNLNYSNLIKIVSVTFLMVFISCKKNGNETTDLQQVYEQKISIDDYNPDRDEIIPLIKAFNQRYTNSLLGYKSGEDFELGEALWLMEAGVNYEYQSNKDSITAIVYDSTTIVLGTTLGDNGELMVDGDELMTAYNDLLTFTENTLLETGETSDLFMADIEVTELNNDTVTLMMTSAIGQVTANTWACAVQSDDYWYPVMGMGYCDGPNVGTGIGQDASTRLNGLFNENRCMEYTCNGTVFFTSIDKFEYIYDYTNQNGTNCFWQGFNSDCLDPTEMEYWLDNGFYAIDGMKPSTKVFIDIYFDWDVVTGSNYYVHFIEWVRYGKLNCGGEEY